jgi:hypothetical protein
MEIFENTNRQRIFLLLMDKPSLSAKKIFLKLGIKYKTVFKELQNMVRFKILVKDDCKRYRINPDYGDELIEYGLKIKGIGKQPDIVVFLKNFNEIMQKMIEIERFLRGNF